MALQYPISDAYVADARSVHSIFRKTDIMAAVKELQDAAALQVIGKYFHGAIGTLTGPGSDGVHVGELTEQAATKFFTERRSSDVICVTHDAGVYVDESTPANEDTGDDVELLPTTPVADADGGFIGHATKKIKGADVNMTTAGDGVLTLTWYYWDGDSYAALQNVVDASTSFTAGTDTYRIAWDVPDDWEMQDIFGSTGYFVYYVVTAYTSQTAAPQAGQLWAILADDEASDYVDETTDFNSAGAGDVPAFPLHPVVGDAGVVIQAAKPFFGLLVTTSQAATGTHTLVFEYSTGAGTWGSLTVVDEQASFSATAAKLPISWEVPSDWVSVTINGQAGYAVRWRLSAITSVTQQPLITQGWVRTCEDGTGHKVGIGGVVKRVQFAATANAGAAADTKVCLVNITQKTAAIGTWTQGTLQDVTADLDLAVDADDEIALVVIAEDGTAEPTNVNWSVEMAAA